MDMAIRGNWARDIVETPVCNNSAGGVHLYEKVANGLNAGTRTTIVNVSVGPVVSDLLA